MGKIELLDCTLRDGGYMNNWEFGKEKIIQTIDAITEAGTDIIEVGFLRDEEYRPELAVWNDIRMVKKNHSANSHTLFAVMGEMYNLFPLDKIPNQSETDVDIIRMICWRKLQKESLEYCAELVKKGYKVCIQPDRVNQYSLEKFKELCLTYSSINPYAIYVVDSNGFLSQREIMDYLRAADGVLPKNIRLGYHGHNSILQAEGAAELFVDAGFERDIIVDGSIYGIGRASGNLNLEIFAKYLNEYHGKSYNILKYLQVYQNVIQSIYEKKQWGYSMEAYISSLYRCNPNYASILKNEYNLGVTDITKVINLLSEEDKVITNKTIIPSLVEQVTKG